MDLNTIKDKISNKTLSGALAVTANADNLNNKIAFYFDVINEHSINIENNITDNYLENNTAIQDAIAHAPITITLSGLIGELVYIPSTNNERFLNRVYNFINKDKQGDYLNNYVVTDKLSAIGQLFPPVDNLTQLAKNAVVYVEDTIGRYKKIYDNITRNIKEKTRLQQVYKDLKDIRDLNIELIVVTPFGSFAGMYIQNINFSQSNENHIANISVTLKELNFTEILVTEANQDVLARYNLAAQAQIENNGKADGAMSKDSTIGKWIYNISGKEPYKLNQ